jgi:GalNAc5-diNAcBac-PP-undecaprenol beta-1,3-glucosyltransferase
LSPFFSVVIPTYNRADLIGDTIQSVLAQTFFDFEIVIVDDGSTDDTKQIVERIASPRVRYYKKKNEERGAARNYGIGKALGEYVVFLDSDDTMHADHLAVLYEHLQATPEDFIATKYEIFSNRGSGVPKDVRCIAGGYHNYTLFLGGNPLACNFTIRKKNPKLSYFREERSYTIMEDWIFLFQNLQFSRLYIIDRITVSLRDHSGRSMRDNQRKVINARMNALHYLLSACTLTADEVSKLQATSNYFCAVHAYIGGHTKDAMRFLALSVSRAGITYNTFFLFIKLCVQLLWGKRKREY